MVRAHITITDTQGNIFEGEVDLVPAASKPSASKRYKPASRQQPLPAKLIFTVNERAFIKKHARELSGAKKFVLLLAYMAKGEIGKEVQLKELEKRWNKMTSSSLLGLEFNRNYSATARENRWVDTMKPGFYVLCQSWKEVLEHGNG